MPSPGPLQHTRERFECQAAGGRDTCCATCPDARVFRGTGSGDEKTRAIHGTVVGRIFRRFASLPLLIFA